MLATGSRAPMMGQLTSPRPTSPGSHRLNRDDLNHLDDDGHPADLSLRSSNSSLVSSNESLLNTSICVPSPTTISSVVQRRERRASAGSSGAEDGVESAPQAITVSHSSEDDLSAFQNLRNAFGQSAFSSYFRDLHNSQDSDNDQMDQQISKAYAILGSPVAPSHQNLLNSPTTRTIKSGSEDEGHHGMALVGHRSPQGVHTIMNDIASVIFQCPLCAVVYNSRHDFNEHLVTHSSEHRTCPRCSFVASNEDVLREHVREIHGTDDIEMLSDHEEVQTPKTNAQGKLKTFKCKQCAFTAVTKKAFWDHNKTHIRQEKMLHCPKCPFVTEYKHHLEYHLRNHMGSKPYQCTVCQYTCVNKSMLNSHLKSHSTVYQYRCQNCSYATKYCHSLKLHLRRYNHIPAMVLDPDGTPNPLPIIDVYGTRRGPKMKRPDPIAQGLATTQPMAVPGSSRALPKKSTPQKKYKTGKAQQKIHKVIGARDFSPKSVKSHQFISSMSNQSTTPPLRKIREDLSSGDSDSEIKMADAQYRHPGKITQLPQAPISPSSIELILQRSNGSNGELAQRKEVNYSHPSTSPIPLDLYNAAAAAINLNLLNPMFLANPHALNELLAAQQIQQQQQQFQQQQLTVHNSMLAEMLQIGKGPVTQQQIKPSDLRTTATTATLESTGMALDLSASSPGKSSNDGRRRRRKGNALIRYERRGTSEDEEEEDMLRDNRMKDEAIDFSNNNNNTDYKDNNGKRFFARKAPTDLSLTSPPPYQNMMCKYCQISFPNE